MRSGASYTHFNFSSLSISSPTALTHAVAALTQVRRNDLQRTLALSDAASDIRAEMVNCLIA